MSKTCVLLVVAGCVALIPFSLPAATTRIEAEDGKACRLEGKTYVFEHPPAREPRLYISRLGRASSFQGLDVLCTYACRLSSTRLAPGTIPPRAPG